MSENDENDVLNGTVDEVKEAVQNLDNPDYEKLLKKEADGKNRKTVKDFLAKKADSEEVDLTDSESEETVNEESDSNSRSIFDKTSNDSAIPLAAAGVVIGLLIGLAAGQMIGGASGSPGVASDNIESLITSGGFNGTVDVGQPQIRNQMYYFNITLSREGPNGTMQNRQQTAYVSKDGILLFPENPLTGIPINMPQQISRQQQAAQNVTR